MTIPSAAGAAATQTAASRTSGYTSLAVLQQAADARREAIDGAVSDALSSDSLKPDESVKALARSQVQALIERVNILKKLFAGNPREMARALAQVFKELKAALKAYKQATGDELGMAGDLATGGIAQAQAAQAQAAQAQGAQSGTSQRPATAEDVATQGEDGATTAAPTLDGAASYAAVTQGVREAVGRDEQSFISDVRGLAQALRDILASACIQAKGAKPDGATAKAFEDADKEYVGLEHALDDADRDLRDAVPTLGLRLSIAA